MRRDVRVLLVGDGACGSCPCQLDPGLTFWLSMSRGSWQVVHHHLGSLLPVLDPSHVGACAADIRRVEPTLTNLLLVLRLSSACSSPRPASYHLQFIKRTFVSNVQRVLPEVTIPDCLDGVTATVVDSSGQSRRASPTPLNARS